MMQNPTPWMTWAQHSNQQVPWSPGWKNPYLGNQFPHNQSPQTQYQQPKLKFHNNIAPINPQIYPQQPAQPITNPNKKSVQKFEIPNMPAYSISPIP